MKLTNQKVIDLINGLNSIADIDLPIAITFKIVGNINKLMDVYSVYEKTKEKVKTDQELLELLKLESEIDLELIEKEELMATDIKISPLQLAGISGIING